MMQAYRVEATVEADGTLRIDAVPFSAGERVEVIVLPVHAEGTRGNPYPLRGLPYRFERPTDPVAEEDWEALR